MGGKKTKLTNPPKNLKEAIDWLAAIEGYGVSGWDHTMGDKLDTKTGELPGWSEAKKESGIINIQGVVKSLGSTLGSRFLGYIGQGVHGFNGNSGIIKSDANYQSTYHDFNWEDSRIHDYLKITLCAAAMAFLGLSYLYYQGSIRRGFENPHDWHSRFLNERDKAIGLYMNTMGFTSNHLMEKTGQEVAELLNGNEKGFDDLAKPNSWSPYSTFLQELETKYGLQKTAVNHPFTACYIAAKEYFTLQFKNGEQIDPCLTSIKQAFNMFQSSCGMIYQALREQPYHPGVTTLLTCALYFPYFALIYPSFTPVHPSPGLPVQPEGGDRLHSAGDGKDGGGGEDGTTDLTAQVKKVLEEVGKSDANFGAEIKNVKDALSTGSGTNGLIGKLAEGLQHFIGYDGTKITSGPLITGGGILPANVAKYQVCNAVLNFVIRFLEGLYGINGVGDTYKPKVSEVIGKLRKCVGTGTVPQGFGELVEGIKQKAGDIDRSFQNNQNKLHDAFDSFKTLVTTLTYDQHGNVNVTQDSEQVKSCLDTVKNGIKQDGSNNFRNLCDKLKDLFGDAELKKSSTSMSNNEALEVTDQSTLKQKYEAVKPDSISNEIKRLNNTKDLNMPANAAVFTAVRDAATAFLAEIKEPSEYTSYYDKAEWSKVKSNPTEVETCAKIFLGCLPLYYQALTYIYWKCHDKGGGWNAMTLAGGAMRFYFDSQGLLPLYVDKSKRGAHIAESALKKFTEFGKAASSSLKDSNSPYVKFTEKLQANVRGNSSNLSTECPLSALLYGASCYFRYQQIKNAKEASKSPKTIREMLYFLAAFQFSPQYGAFYGYVTDYFKTLTGSPSSDDSELKLQVADSGTSATGNTLSAADLKSYLTSTFHLAPAFIGVVQGHSTSGEPWLHSLFSNSQFKLSIPSSGAGIFRALSNYAYALQFQLHFLYQQCSNNGMKCGWQDCRYGRNVKMDSSGNYLQSHICPGFKCSDPNSCNHIKGTGGTNCNHNNYSQSGGCGKGHPSPLQAFITGVLPSFGLSSSSTPNHMSAHPQGALCHTPMGFEATHLRQDPGTGNYILSALRPICGDVSSPFRQLCEKLGCLTKRTPRSLGDLFGFYAQLID
ncbi:variant erythrocyte surface antigen-1 family protein [Babesia caballi]|uniref:Variant erythrocyte surface antigen-1 family protein n=1 Tax=Babesia caballi TaxID=5871 RepID=A0AAV4M175_BABCB|nr:variant erythrocyte surface antigen-1 family protein [Babesia caballi]